MNVKQVLVLACGSCGFPQDSGAEICGSCGIDPRLTVEPCENCKGGAREIPGGCTQCDGLGNDETAECGARFEDRKILISQGYQVPDEEIVTRLNDPAAEYIRRHGGGEVVGRELILFDEEPESEARPRTSPDEIEVDLTDDFQFAAYLAGKSSGRESVARAAEFLGEAIEFIETAGLAGGLAEGWVNLARPFARFREEPTYRFSPRGIGLEWNLTCFCCGVTHHEERGSDDNGGSDLLNNIAAFVSSKDDGEAIVSLFGEHGARLDFREREPEWIQVKVGACDSHLPNLRELSRATAAEGKISAATIRAARSFK